MQVNHGHIKKDDVEIIMVNDCATVGSVVWIGRPLIITVLVGSMSVLLIG